MAWLPLLAVWAARLIGHIITKGAAARYRPATGGSADPLGPVAAPMHSGISVVTMVTMVTGRPSADPDLDPDAFALGLRSWLAAGAREVIVLIGPDDAGYHAVLESPALEGLPVTVLRRRLDPRLDLYASWHVASGDLVAYVPPGTLWAPDVAQRAANAFAPAVGGVAVRHNAGRTRTLAQRLGDADEDLKTYGRAAAGSHLRRTVIGSWKGTAVFRRSVLFDVEHDFITGPVPADDFAERLAALVTVAGWDTRFQRSARVWPLLPVSLRQLVSEAYARGRDGWPGFRLRSLRHRPSRPGEVTLARRRPYRSLCTLSWLLAGPATLIGLGYGAAAIWAGVWQTALVLAAWSVVTHAIVMLPHLRRRPRSVVIVPAHLVVAGLLDLTGLAGMLIGASRFILRRLAGRPMRARSLDIPAPRPSGDPPAGTASARTPAIDPALRLKPLPAVTGSPEGSRRL